MAPTTLRSPPLVAEVGLEIGFAEDPETKDLVARKVLGNQGLARWKPGNQDDGFPRSRSPLLVMQSEIFQGKPWKTAVTCTEMQASFKCTMDCG